ncbi:MAG TPA: tRNA lysidine(34) synthetase TilS [Frankiaceae bacterium]|nr:tRNA lysidine(34) synthetase TilS [Frankiaceae bacterium]
MAGPPSAVAAVRLAVRKALADLPAGERVLVAGSGGPDSTALAAAAAFVAPRAGLSAGFACADQHWSEESGRLARAAVEAAEGLGLQPAVVLDAPAARNEGAARDARRSALLALAEQQGAAAILLGHTLDDQAETVLLRLARGSGARSLAAMAARDGIWRRPLLGLRRTVVHDSCAQAGLVTWDDPANVDPSFARSRVRADVLPLLERALGPGIAESLARSAGLLRADADALDALAAASFADARALPGDFSVRSLDALASAIRSRVLRAAALEAGCPPTDLNAAHIAALDALVTAWKGQGPLSLPGGVKAERHNGTLTLSAPTGDPKAKARQMRV